MMEWLQWRLLPLYIDGPGIVCTSLQAYGPQGPQMHPLTFPFQMRVTKVVMKQYEDYIAKQSSLHILSL